MNESIRKIDTATLRDALITMIEEASFELLPEVEEALARLARDEKNETARMTMNILLENARIAREKKIPLCQDCGSVSVFIDAGQNVLFIGGPLGQAVDDAVRTAYERFYLRKSLVGDPLRRVNTGANTPAFVHTEIVPGSRLKLSVYLKGGGSENMTALKMFRPTASPDDLVEEIARAVIEAGPNPCPPLFLGVGMGGTADVAMINSRRAVLRGPGTRHEDPLYAGLEERLLERLNRTGVGPLGFGGAGTVAAVFIKEAPAHIATLPVALNLNCHSLRYRTVEL
jgi:fumarate hydratase subunit alpha